MKIGTIKNGAINGKNARTVIQRRDLAQYGFECHRPIEVDYCIEENFIGIFALDNTLVSKNKVSCVNDKRRGYEYQTIDLRWKLEDRKEMFGDAEKLDIHVVGDAIYIVAEGREMAE